MSTPHRTVSAPSPSPYRCVRPRTRTTDRPYTATIRIPVENRDLRGRPGTPAGRPRTIGEDDRADRVPAGGAVRPRRHARGLRVPARAGLARGAGRRGDRPL